MSTLKVSKDFQCSKENLYKAWTEPEQLKQWWKPMGKQLLNVENNLVEGGLVKYQFEDDSLVIDGEYEKVEAANLLEYTWNWHLAAAPSDNAAFKLTVRFEGDEEHGTISITQDGFENEESIQPHRNGWEQGLEQLNSFVGQQQPAQDAVTESHRPPTTGYNETPEQEKVGGG